MKDVIFDPYPLIGHPNTTGALLPTGGLPLVPPCVVPGPRGEGSLFEGATWVGGGDEDESRKTGAYTKLQRDRENMGKQMTESVFRAEAMEASQRKVELVVWIVLGVGIFLSVANLVSLVVVKKLLWRTRRSWKKGRHTTTVGTRSSSGVDEVEAGSSHGATANVAQRRGATSSCCEK